MGRVKQYKITVHYEVPSFAQNKKTFNQRHITGALFDAQAQERIMCRKILEENPNAKIVVTYIDEE